MKAAPHKRCQHLENYGLARTAERALLLALSAHHERVPRAVAWGEIFGDDMAATAMVDRLIHHAEILSLKGDSYRLKDRDLGPRAGRQSAEIA
jgi:IstB-like ATP binding protein